MSAYCRMLGHNKNDWRAAVPLTECRECQMDSEIDLAERKAIDSLARYKFAMFGYWAGIWVHLNRIEGKKRPNPFKQLVLTARRMTT